MVTVKSTDQRRKARTLVIQCLFAADISKIPDNASMDWLNEENPLPNKSLNFARMLMQGVTENISSIDLVIRRFAPAWPVNQISLIDRNILRLALFEMIYFTDTPRKTAINEAVELGKLFGSQSSARFVNGVLGSAMAELETGELAPK
jgi:N utilization substance protein B